MKILIVVTSLPVDFSSIKGGVHSALINLLHGFNSQQSKVRVLSMESDVTTTRSVAFASDIDICYEPRGRFPFHSLNYFFSGPTLLRKHIQSFRPDILHFQMGNTLLLSTRGKYLPLPLVLTLHAFAWEEMRAKKSITEKLTWWFNGLIHRLLAPRNIIYISEQSRLNNATPRQTYTVIPNALKADFFRLPAKPKTDNILLYVGVINHRKNIRHLLESMARLRQQGKIFHLHIVGDFVDQAYADAVQMDIDSFGISEQLKFWGWQSQAEVMRLLTASDILVMPSLQETLPMVIAEAKAAGKVVVASQVGGIPEMINHGEDGFLFPSGQTDELTSILSNLHNNNPLVLQVSQRARKHTEETQQADRVAKQTLAFYQRVLHADR